MTDGPTSVLVTGADGFIGKNLVVRLSEAPAQFVVHPVNRHTSAAELADAVGRCDVVVHLAGVNRPQTESEFESGNVGSTETLVRLLEAAAPKPVLFSSSTQAVADNAYGRSKLDAEQCLAGYSARTGATTISYRLTNVFGKWCRPHYNSAVATFCHLVARGEPLDIHDPAAPLRLLYIDDLVDHLVTDVRAVHSGRPPRAEIGPVYETTVGALAEELRQFASVPVTRDIPRTGTGLTRALYATYLSHLEPSSFSFPLTRHVDARGAFSEMLRTADSGQFSFFTAGPGVTRGGHYHHTKNEKFLVVRGAARYRFRHVVSGETYELTTLAEEARVVMTVPGWTHDITNIGDEEMVVMLWANEAFDRSRPDTIANPL